MKEDNLNPNIFILFHNQSVCIHALLFIVFFTDIFKTKLLYQFTERVTVRLREGEETR